MDIHCPFDYRAIAPRNVTESDTTLPQTDSIWNYETLAPIRRCNGYTVPLMIKRRKSRGYRDVVARVSRSHRDVIEKHRFHQENSEIASTDQLAGPSTFAPH